MLETKEQSVGANNYTWSALKMLVEVIYSIVRKGHKPNQNKSMETTIFVTLPSILGQKLPSFLEVTQLPDPDGRGLAQWDPLGHLQLF